VKTEDELLAEAKLKEQQAIQEANLLIQELNNSPVLDVLAKQLELRLIALAKDDPVCQALLKTIDGLGYKLSAAHQARKLVRKRMGPQLSQFLEETEAAPE
jgi:uncharacterized protein YjgD (DUF1641 family)